MGQKPTKVSRNPLKKLLFLHRLTEFEPFQG